jgi:hypothetical protein
MAWCLEINSPKNLGPRPKKKKKKKKKKTKEKEWGCGPFRTEVGIVDGHDSG